MANDVTAQSDNMDGDNQSHHQSEHHHKGSHFYLKKIRRCLAL
jgi:hypothetical protein